MYEQRSYEFSFFGIVWSSLILSYLRLDHVSVRFTSLLWQTGSSVSWGQTQKSKILKYKTASSKLSSRLTSTADLSVDTNLSLLLFLVSFRSETSWVLSQQIESILLLSHLMLTGGDSAGQKIGCCRRRCCTEIKSFSFPYESRTTLLHPTHPFLSDLYVPPAGLHVWHAKVC